MACAENTRSKTFRVDEASESQHELPGDPGMLQGICQAVHEKADCTAQLVLLQRNADVYPILFQSVL